MLSRTHTHTHALEQLSWHSKQNLNNTTLASKLTTLEDAMSDARKVFQWERVSFYTNVRHTSAFGVTWFDSQGFRYFKFLEEFQRMRELNEREVTLRLLLLASSFSRWDEKCDVRLSLVTFFLSILCCFSIWFYLLDHLIWISRLRLINLKTVMRWGWVCVREWEREEERRRRGRDRRHRGQPHQEKMQIDFFCKKYRRRTSNWKSYATGSALPRWFCCLSSIPGNFREPPKKLLTLTNIYECLHWTNKRQVFPCHCHCHTELGQ